MRASTRLIAPTHLDKSNRYKILSSPQTHNSGYNTVRTHQGRWCYGKTPMQTFVDTLAVAKEKLLQTA
jgi:hypothetical protein